MRPVRLSPLLGATALIGHTVAIVESGGRLLVTGTATGEVVADHKPVAPGEASVADEHYGGPRPAPRRAVRPKTAAEKAFCALGRPLRRSSPGRRPRATPGSPPTWMSWPRCGPPTATAR